MEGQATRSSGGDGAHQLVRPHLAARDELRLRQARALDAAILHSNGALALLLDFVSEELGVRDALREEVLEALDFVLFAAGLQRLLLGRHPLLLFLLALLCKPADR